MRPSSALLLLAACTAHLDALEAKVWPKLLHVRPGSPQEITVSVDRLPAGAATAAIEVVIETGLGERLLERGGEAAPGRPLSFAFAPTREWGHEVRVTARAGGETATGAEVFTCAANVHKVNPDYGGDQICGFDVRADGSPGPEGGPPANADVVRRIERLLGNDRNEYIAVSEIGPGWCGFCIKPEQPNYFTGGGYRNATNLVRHYIERAHALGLSVVIYANACVKGPAGTEFAREHPEYLTFQPNGTPMGPVFVENYRAHREFIADYPRSLARWSRDAAWRKLLDAGYPGFLNEQLDFEDPALSRLGSEMILEGQAHFGYDGVRYDGLYQVPSIGDPLAPSYDIRNWQGHQQKTGTEGEALSVRNLGIQFDTLRKARPDFLIGMNWASFRPDYCGAGKAEDFAMNRAIAPGMCVLDEVAKGSLDVFSPTYRWAGFVDIMTRQVDSARRLGNFVYAGWGGGPGHHEVDMKLVKSFSFACGLRWIRGGWNRDPRSRVVARTWNRFAVRHGEFLFHERLERIPREEAGRLISVAGSRPLIHQDLAYRLTTDRGSFLVLNLINQPLEDHQTRDAKEPPPAEDVVVSLMPGLFRGRSPMAGRVAVLDPERPDAAGGAIAADGRLAVAIPRLGYWALVVVPLGD